ncbi:MAG: hypothetical protein ACTSX7_01425 [Alphaproteobacteria bacterium]
MARLLNTRSFVYALCALATFAAVPAAHAAGQGPKCGPRNAIAKVLTARFAELPVSIGLAKDGAVLELFTTASGGTWTLLATNPKGVSCIVSHGESWMSMTPVSGRIS